MDERADYPQSSRHRGDPRAGTVGCLAFFACLALGLVATDAVADYVIRDLPDREVFEALHRGGVRFRWYCGGALVSLIVSIAVAVLLARRVVRKTAQSDDGLTRL